MNDNIFQVDLQHSTEKCLVAVGDKGTSSCQSCGKPAHYIVRGHCTHCAIMKGIKLLQSDAAVLNQT
jgi:hypothetical protein